MKYTGRITLVGLIVALGAWVYYMLKRGLDYHNLNTKRR